MEHWWNDNEKERTQLLGEKSVLVTRPPS